VNCAVQTAVPREPLTKKERLRQTIFYIATDGELRILESLETDEMLDSFWAQFWALRDPDPATPENEFMDTYMERWQYVEEKFGGQEPGWCADQGRIYLVYGDPISEFSGSTDDMTSDEELYDRGSILADENEDWRTVDIGSVSTHKNRRFSITNPNQRWIIWIYDFTRPLEVVENNTIFYFEKKATNWRLVWTNNIREKGYNSGARIPAQAQQIINDYLH